MPLIFETLLDDKREMNTETAEWTNERGRTLLYSLWISYVTRLTTERDGEKYINHSLNTQDLETVEGISNGHSSLY
jgi:hypothetical protein